jgi:hypothetical protein
MVSAGHVCSFFPFSPQRLNRIIRVPPGDVRRGDQLVVEFRERPFFSNHDKLAPLVGHRFIVSCVVAIPDLAWHIPILTNQYVTTGTIWLLLIRAEC